MFTTTPHDNLTVPTKSEGNLKGDPETTVAVEEPVDIMEEIRKYNFPIKSFFTNY